MASRTNADGGNVTAASETAVRIYEGSQAEDWDNLVRRSCNGTFLHTRRFLSYHGDRFVDCSLVIGDRRGRIRGVFPAAVSPGRPEMIVSHPGLTYGGLVHDGSIRGASTIAILREIIEHYRRSGYSHLRYKAVPAIYHSMPAEDDLYALFRLNARRYRSDLSSTIDLSSRGKVDHGRIYSRKVARAAGVSIDESWDGIAGFWSILEANLAERRAASPVHSLSDIQLLRNGFPDEILLLAARIGETLVGGGLLFATGPTLHLQYTATTHEGRTARATDLIIEHAIDLARHRGHRYFDFGVSTPDEGWSLDEALYQFKLSFGAGGVVYDHYEVELQ
jgi:hypothetical protein